jgi:hypothetical protein
VDGWSVLVSLDVARSIALSLTAEFVSRALDSRHDVAAVRYECGGGWPSEAARAARPSLAAEGRHATIALERTSGYPSERRARVLGERSLPVDDRVDDRTKAGALAADEEDA